MNQLTVIIALVVALAASVGVNLKQWQSCAVEVVKQEGRVNTAAADAKTVATEKARDVETQAQIRAEAVAEGYEKGKKDAEDAGNSTVADLRSDVLRLRQRWASRPTASCLPETADTTRKRDAEAESQRESAGRIIRAADECQAQVLACQAFILSEREPVGAEGKH